MNSTIHLRARAEIFFTCVLYTKSVFFSVNDVSHTELNFVLRNPREGLPYKKEKETAHKANH